LEEYEITFEFNDGSSPWSLGGEHSTGRCAGAGSNDFSQLQATLKQNDKLTVTTESGMKIKGKMIEVSPDQIVLNSNGAPQQIRFQNSESAAKA
jgi:hypothetical protein